MSNLALNENTNTGEQEERSLPYLNVYEWTTKFATEQVETNEYIWTVETKVLLRRLTHPVYRLP